MNNMVQRVTPLTVLTDIKPSLSRYRGLGFDVVDTGDPGCVGLRAGDTYLILATVQHMAGQFPSAVVQRLTDQTTPYLLSGRSKKRWRACPRRRPSLRRCRLPTALSKPWSRMTANA
jgi:hypothetical protein